MESDDLGSAASVAITNNNPNNIINNKNNVNVLINDFSKKLSANSESKYTILHDFSFAELMRRNPELGQVLSVYPQEVLLKTQEVLIRKCTGNSLSMPAIMVWINKQNEYYRKKI